MSLACSGVENCLRNLGTKGKYRKTFTGTIEFPTRLNLGDEHLRHICSSTYCPRNNMHPLMQAWILTYANPKLLSNFEASYSDLGSVLGCGRIVFPRALYTSVMHTFGTAELRSAFIRMSVAGKEETVLPP